MLIGKRATELCYKPTSINVNHLKPEEKKNMDSQEKGTTQNTSVFLCLVFNFFSKFKNYIPLKTDCILIHSTLFKTLPIRNIKDPGDAKMSK